MGINQIYLAPSTRKTKKWMVYVSHKGSNRTIHFGAKGMSDYTIHKDKQRQKRYIARHSGMGETWSKKGIQTAGFWSRWLLWGLPDLDKSIRMIERKFGVEITKVTKKQFERVRKSQCDLYFRGDELKEYTDLFCIYKL